MAITTVSRTDLVGLTSLSYIRPIRLTWTVSGTKPGTRLYAFFDGKAVGQYITPDGGSKGGNIVTNAAGSISGVFDIPPVTFNTGERLFKLQDSSVYNVDSIPGATLGSASAVFTSAGLLKTFQDTITRTNTVEINQVVTNKVVVNQIATAPNFRREQTDSGGSDGGDPLAQTFFTYGIKGGCFVTKIDIYFQTKDENIPVILELRNVVNGYPGPTVLSGDASVILTPAQVNVSNNSSVATTFTFNAPVYLAEDQEYCFVLRSNSNGYHVWTSEMGATSIETGKKIFEQPHIGSLFKSENNTTWTAEQTQDIKFTLYKAKFDITSDKEIAFKANAQPLLIMGDELSVTSGSAVVTCNFKFQHGQRTGDKIYLTGLTGATYRGIPSATISNVSGFTVTVINEYSLTFNVGTNATSTGTLQTSGILNAVDVDQSGSGYVSPSITITGNGSGATATAVVVGGKIVSVNVTNPGSGYTNPPSYTLSDAAGVGAILAPISEAIFVSALTRKYQTVEPIVNAFIPPQTSITNTLRTSNENYTIGAHEIFPINQPNSTNKNAVIVDAKTELASFGGSPSTQMILRMTSNNSNVSPIIDLTDTPPTLHMHNYIINDESNVASETSNTGTAYSRYVSKPISLATVSIGARVLVQGASITETGFDVFFRTSLATSGVDHDSGTWVKMNCDTTRHASPTLDDYRDYEFYLDGIAPFDVYDVKIVLSTSTKYLVPRIKNYRVIILAT